MEGTFSLVTGLPPLVCKSIAKASKVRILHLPPRAERAPDLRKRGSGALSCTRRGTQNGVPESFFISALGDRAVTAQTWKADIWVRHRCQDAPGRFAPIASTRAGVRVGGHQCDARSGRGPSAVATDPGWPAPSARARTRTCLNTLLSAEADSVCGAAYGTRDPERTNRRNGYRHRDLDTAGRDHRGTRRR